MRVVGNGRSKLLKMLHTGQTSSKKLTFNNPAVYETIVDVKRVEVYNVEMQRMIRLLGLGYSISS